MFDVDLVVLRRSDDKVRQFMGAPLQILQIENAFGESSKEPRHAVLQNFAARAEQRSVRIELVPERNQIAFIAAASVQQQQSSLCLATNEFVNEVRLHG